MVDGYPRLHYSFRKEIYIQKPHRPPLHSVQTVKHNTRTLTARQTAPHCASSQNILVEH